MITAQEPMTATVNQTISLSGQPKRFTFHMETNKYATRVRLRNTISHRLKAIIVSSSSTVLLAFRRGFPCESSF